MLAAATTRRPHPDTECKGHMHRRVCEAQNHDRAHPCGRMAQVRWHSAEKEG
ncbi:hypothetical protein BKA93DRAFT_790761 [Sparassis latifolia]